MKVKGPEALRLSQLYDGTPNTTIPPVDMFVKNEYKTHHIPDIPRDKLKDIIKHNCFYDEDENKPENLIFPF